MIHFAQISFLAAMFLGLSLSAEEQKELLSASMAEKKPTEESTEISSDLIEGAPTAKVKDPVEDKSKQLRGVASVAETSLPVKDDYNPEVEAKIRIVAKKRLYPGGHDEEDLKVQTQLFVPERKLSSKKKSLQVESQED